MAQMNLLARVNRVAKALAGLIAFDKSPKAELNLQALNDLIQNSADDHLAQLIAEAREKLRANLTAAVAKTAPGAVPEVADEIGVVVYVVMHDETLRAKLNAAARKAGIKDAIAYLKAALAADAAE